MSVLAQFSRCSMRRISPFQASFTFIRSYSEDSNQSSRRSQSDAHRNYAPRDGYRSRSQGRNYDDRRGPRPNYNRSNFADQSFDRRQTKTAPPREPWRLSEKPADCRLVWVGSLSYDATENDLMSLFEQCGQVVNIRIARRHGRSRGFAHVEFDSTDAVDKAIKLQEIPVAGRNIVVDYAEASKPRSEEGEQNRS